VLFNHKMLLLLLLLLLLLPGNNHDSHGHSCRCHWCRWPTYMPRCCYTCAVLHATTAAAAGMNANLLLRSSSKNCHVHKLKVRVILYSQLSHTCTSHVRCDRCHSMTARWPRAPPSTMWRPDRVKAML
jgi:hypothetical protein